MAKKKKKPTVDRNGILRALKKFVKAYEAHEAAEAELSRAEVEHEEAVRKLEAAKKSVHTAVSRYEKVYGEQENQRYVLTIDGLKWSVSIHEHDVFIDTVVDLGEA